MPEIFTTAEIAGLLGVPVWKIQRLFSDGDLSDVGRFAGKRAVPSAMLPRIVDALRDRGWLPEPESTASSSRRGGAP